MFSPHCTPASSDSYPLHTKSSKYIGPAPLPKCALPYITTFVLSFCKQDKKKPQVFDLGKYDIQCTEPKKDMQ